MDERFLQKQTAPDCGLSRRYDGDGSNTHYHPSRYSALNLHSVFSHGTLEFRLFNSTVEHAGKIKADIQPGLGICAQALKPAGRQPHQDPDHKPGLHFRTWLLRFGYDQMSPPLPGSTS